jgi:hypothetical protein
LKESLIFDFNFNSKIPENLMLLNGVNNNINNDNNKNNLSIDKDAIIDFNIKNILSKKNDTNTLNKKTADIYKNKKNNYSLKIILLNTLKFFMKLTISIIFLFFIYSMKLLYFISKSINFIDNVRRLLNN